MVCLDRKQEVWSALNVVTDPEIDESVVSLDFVTAVKVDSNNRVEIDFRLPTYWCAPNFAFLMASDMRDAVTALEWVSEVSVKLFDHFSADLINRGVALRQDFRDAFPGETDDDLSAVRQKFLGKAFERRQELLLRYLLARGFSPDYIARARLSDLLHLPMDPEGASLRNLYLFILRRIKPDIEEEAPAFTTLGRMPLASRDLKGYLRKIAAVRRDAEFNGFFCRSLLSEREQRSRSENPDTETTR
ncbi:MAG TPA: iron-sulfur cluster assembly protein [Chthoniobacterales bacterium]|jgi:metal-sulfur cluster biosynthetic enzyme|nr:iron-sulfur cluster assembly protein [Chthoniobacterales bacterium]